MALRLGVYTAELMLCVATRASARCRTVVAVALPTARYAVARRSGAAGVTVSGSRALVKAQGVIIDLEFDEGAAVETASPAGDSYIWTAKQAAIPVRGSVVIDGAEHPIEGDVGFIDDSRHHPRHTAWRWSAGAGRLEDGRRRDGTS